MEHSNLFGYECFVDEGFVKCVTRFADVAKLFEFGVWITSSFRQKGSRLKGAVVEEATFSNHLVGHAIDFNFYRNGVFINNSKMKYFYKLYKDGAPFPNSCIKAIKTFEDMDRSYTWGGKFKTQDCVHIDDNLWRRDRSLWNDLYEKYQD